MPYYEGNINIFLTCSETHRANEGRMTEKCNLTELHAELVPLNEFEYSNDYMGCVIRSSLISLLFVGGMYIHFKCKSFVLSIFDELNELSYCITYYNALHYIVITCTHACNIISLEFLPEPGRRLHKEAWLSFGEINDEEDSNKCPNEYEEYRSDHCNHYVTLFN